MSQYIRHIRPPSGDESEAGEDRGWRWVSNSRFESKQKIRLWPFAMGGGCHSVLFERDKRRLFCCGILNIKKTYFSYDRSVLWGMQRTTIHSVYWMKTITECWNSEMECAVWFAIGDCSLTSATWTTMTISGLQKLKTSDIQEDLFGMKLHLVLCVFSFHGTNQKSFCLYWTTEASAGYETRGNQ